MFTWDKYSISGGLVGYLGQYGEIYDCYTEGTVEARIGQGNGGIAGLLAAGNSSVIKNCFSTCEMKGTDATGGIAGLSIGVIEDCYFAGSMSKGSYTIGGDTGEMGMLVGKYSGSGLKNCEYYGDTSPGIGAVGTDSTGTYTSVVDKGALPDTPITTLYKVDYSTGDDVKPIEPEKNLSIKLQVGINAQESSQIIIKKD